MASDGPPRPLPPPRRPHRRRRCPAAGPLLHPPRRRLRRPVRLAQPRPAHRRQRRERRRQPRAPRRRDRPPARALRCTGARSMGRPCAARPSRPGPPRPAAEEDGQATALDDVAALVFTADCLPVMLVAEGAVAALHGGWRGLAEGIVAEGVQALRELGADGPVTAALGPVGARLLLRGRRGGPRSLRGLRRAGGRAQPRPRGGRPPRSSRRPASSGPTTSGSARCAPTPDLFFSHRRDQRRHRAPGGSRMAGLITGLEPDAVRAATERVREEIAAAARKAGPRPGRGRAAGRRQVRRARGDRRPRRGGPDPRGREPRPGARGQGDRAPRAALALHRPAPEPQGQADPARTSS